MANHARRARAVAAARARPALDAFARAPTPLFVVALVACDALLALGLVLFVALAAAPPAVALRHLQAASCNTRTGAWLVESAHFFLRVPLTADEMQKAV